MMYICNFRVLVSAERHRCVSRAPFGFGIPLCTAEAYRLCFVLNFIL